MKVLDIKELHKQFKEYRQENGQDYLKSSFSPSLDLGDKIDTKVINKEEIKKDRLIKKKYTILGQHLKVKEYSHAKYVRSGQDKKIFKHDSERIENKFNELIYQSGNAFMLEQEFILDYADELEDYYKFADNIINLQKKKNREDSVRRSRQKVLDLAFCNPQLKYFLTLTFSEEEFTNYNKAFDEFKKFRNKVNMYMKRNFNMNFEYLCTFETQKTGKWHMHMLCNLDYRLFYDKKIEVWYDDLKKKKKSKEKKDLNDIIVNKFWKLGFADYQEMYNSEGSAYYMVKYMCKETDDVMLQEGVKSRYKRSKGLNEPIEIFIYENEDKEIEEEKEKSLLLALADVEKNDCYSKRVTLYDDFNMSKLKCKQILYNEYSKQIIEIEEKRVIKETFYMKKVDKLNDY